MEKLPLRPNVCMLVFNQEGKVFLGEREGEPGVWQLPQGGVEPQYSLEENVLRELEEEIGISKSKLKIMAQLKARHEYDWANPPDYAKGKWRGQSQTFWVVKFLGKDSDINLHTHTPEFMNWRWCSVDEVRAQAEQKRVPGYQAALEEYEMRFLGK